MDMLSAPGIHPGSPSYAGSLVAAQGTDLQGIPPELLEMLQYLLLTTGGSGTGDGGGMVSSGPSNFGGGGTAGVSGSDLGRCFEGFLGGSGSSGSSPGSGTGGYVSGGRDSYVPGGFEALDRGGAVADSARGADAVAWAESQLGVSEASNPATVRGYSNGNWQAWCADFVSKSFEKTGGSPFGHQSSVAGILSWGKANDRFTSAAAAAKNPGSLQIGDIATWKSAGKSHVGLVTGVNKDGTFTTIEGNTSDKVARRTHSFQEKGLTGFVRATKTELAGKTTTADRSKKSGGASGSSSSSSAAGASSASSAGSSAGASSASSAGSSKSSSSGSSGSSSGASSSSSSGGSGGGKK